MQPNPPTFEEARPEDALLEGHVTLKNHSEMVHGEPMPGVKLVKNIQPAWKDRDPRAWNR